MEQKRKPISSRVRALVLSRDNHRCRMCGRTSDEVSLEVDHVFPYSLGGTDDLDNLATLCRDCNIGKSDLLLRSVLKQKIASGDFTPIGEIALDVKYNTLTYGEGKQHEYQLGINVFNGTNKTIVNPQLEIVLPFESIQTISSRGNVTRTDKMARVFFSKLDVERIHPQKSEVLMETANVGLYYKVNNSIYWQKQLMESIFEVILYGEDIPATFFKMKFSQMQCF